MWSTTDAPAQTGLDLGYHPGQGPGPCRMRDHVQFKVELVSCCSIELNSLPAPRVCCACVFSPGERGGYQENTIFGLFNCCLIELNRVQLETRES